MRSVLERTHHNAASLFPDASLVRRYEELISDPGVELVIVNTPDRFHFDMASKALAAGKHVVVEKPFTLTALEAEALIAKAAACRRLLTVFQNRRWDGDFMTVRQVVESGRLGKLVEFEAHFDRYRPEVAQNTWKEEGVERGGVLYNLGSHMVDQALQLFGVPRAVTAHLRICRPEAKVYDYYDVRMHYPELTVILKSSYLVAEQGPRYILHGMQGSFLKWGIDPQEERLKQGLLPAGERWGEEPESNWGLLHTIWHEADFQEIVHTIPGDYPAFYRNLYAAVRHGEPLAVKPEEALTGIRVLEACLESHKQQKTINL